MKDTIENVSEVLLSLKEEALEATKNADSDFYENYLDKDALAIVPAGVFDKNAIVQQMGSSQSAFRSLSVNDTKAVALSPESGFVTYKAVFEKPDKTTFEVFVTTIYAKRDGGWKGILYQQTPV